MGVLELVCAAIVLAYVAMQLARASERRGAFLARFGLLAAGAFVGEDTVIRAYGYYAYDASWSLWLDRVPIVVVLVWPVVIDSAAALARSLTRGPLRVAALAATIVLLDAALIEPIAVRAGLWAWTRPGAFSVPLIGIAGWAMFTWAAVVAIEAGRAAVVPLFAPAVTHLLLLASYYAGFRWFPGPIPDVAVVVTAWVVLPATALVGARWSRRVEVRDVLARAPGALFFFGLLATLPRDQRSPLVAYALAFALPYLVALARGARTATAPALR